MTSADAVCTRSYLVMCFCACVLKALVECIVFYNDLITSFYLVKEVIVFLFWFLLVSGVMTAGVIYCLLVVSRNWRILKGYHSITVLLNRGLIFVFICLSVSILSGNVLQNQLYNGLCIPSSINVFLWSLPRGYWLGLLLALCLFYYENKLKGIYAN